MWASTLPGASQAMFHYCSSMQVERMDELEKWTMPAGRGVDARFEDHEGGGQVCSRTEHGQAMALRRIRITEMS